MTPELTSPLLTTTPHQREDVSALERFNLHRCSTWWFFSGTGLELVIRQAMIRYLYHLVSAATSHIVGANTKSGGIQRLPHRWQHVVIVEGDYTEGL
ncbi:uncharacterized protein TNCV_2106861 [Trichonephila clavipes]|nr:uncharacterized protein TNCV_2106861 [Trichonephila clavipes]